MPLQDLTPQLRTRLSRVERAVGLFVIVATLALLVGLAYYMYDTAKRKGWFDTKVNYATSLNDASGITSGDPVTLMGFPVGEVIDAIPNPPEAQRGVTVFFRIKSPYYGYIWLDSVVRVNSSDFLGHRHLEIIKGRTGAATAYDSGGQLYVLKRMAVRNRLLEVKEQMKNAPENKGKTEDEIAIAATNAMNKIIKTETSTFYTTLKQGRFDAPIDSKITNYVWVPPVETPALGDRLEAVAATLEAALPNILDLTNKVAGVLTNASGAVARLDSTIADARPIVTNLAVITGNLRNPNGSLGTWLIPTNLAARLETTLQTADATMLAARTTIDDTDTNVTAIALELDKSLANLAGLTSNLNWQVEQNTNLVTAISTAIVHTDGLIEGLKRHWLLRSAFKKKATNHVERVSPPK